MFLTIAALSILVLACCACFARVIFSPIITSMSGRIGDGVFSRWKGINYVRSRVIPANPQTDLQTAQREALANTLTMWQSVKSWAQAVWNRYAEGYAKSGYNRYIEDNILHTKAGTAGSLTPDDPDYIKISAQAAAAGGAGEISCSWTNDSGVHGTDYVAAYYRQTETGSEAYAWTHGGFADVDNSPITVSGLDTGEEYEVAFFAHIAALASVQESYNEVLNAG